MVERASQNIFQLLDSAVHAFESLFRDAVKDNENNEQLFEAVSQIEEKILKVCL